MGFKLCGADCFSLNQCHREFDFHIYRTVSSRDVICRTQNHIGAGKAEVLKAADAALYRAKQEGKGKLVLAEPLSTADPTAMHLEE